jgi:uncharacterized protein CbrC (UPF0167 family)
MQSLTGFATQLERRIQVVLRTQDADSLGVAGRENIAQLKKALHEIKLDVRDYTYAQTRAEQLKWAELGRHNLAVLHALLLSLDAVFSPADIAQFGAYVDELSSSLQ